MKSNKTKKIYRAVKEINFKMTKSNFSEESLGIPEGFVLTNLTVSEVRGTVSIVAVKSDELTENRLAAIINNIKPLKAPKVSAVKSKGEKVMGTFFFPDLHLGRLVWGEEGNGKNLDSYITKEVFKNAVNKAVATYKAMPYDFEEIHISGLGDIMNSDTVDDTTTAGTQQFSDTRWQQMWSDAAEIVTYAVATFAENFPNAKVYYQSVEGNHDRTKTFFLASCVKNYLRMYKNVCVDTSPNPRRIVKYKNNLIVLTHGEEGKRAKDLPFTMPEARKFVSTSKNIEVIQGHLHTHKAEFCNEGVYHETLACSADASDSWSASKGYHEAAGEYYCHIYSENNRLAQFILHASDLREEKSNTKKVSTSKKAVAKKPSTKKSAK